MSMPVATASALIRLAPGSTRLEQIDTAYEWVQRFSQEWTPDSGVSLTDWMAVCEEMANRLMCYRIAETGR